MDMRPAPPAGAVTRRRVQPVHIVALLLFVTIAFAALTLPDHPDAIAAHAFARLPLELPLLGLCLLLLPRRAATVLSWLSTLAVITLLFLKLADIGVQSAFQRPFNPYLDGKMVVDGWNVLSGSVGLLKAGVAIGLSLAVLAGLVSALLWSQRKLIRFPRPARGWLISFLALMALLGAALLATRPATGLPVIAELHAAPYLDARLRLIATSIADMRVFERVLAKPQEPVSGNGLFRAVKGRDVILVFVESYGRSAVEDPRYSSLIRPRLTAVESQLDSAGFAAASGWTRSSTSGGLSWLAHGTFLSGLWVDSQARYDRLVRSDRLSLNRLFQQAGWRTAAIMPAITMDWPEASFFGYDQVLAARDLGYRGKPFNWVTMPDQYTLDAFERLARKPDGQPEALRGKPVMAEIALISSHAPWTPVPNMIDWASVGDGKSFDAQATSGDPPPVVWADHDRVRHQYIRTIDYSLQVLGDYIARYGRDAVFVVLGDHQPAPIITGAGASRAVPIHVISRDRALVQRFEESGFTQGMTPDRGAPEPGMDGMRDLLIRTLSAP